MTTPPEPAAADVDWLEPHDLYLTTGADVEIDRPIYQGDVFANVPLFVFPEVAPTSHQVEVEVAPGPVMVVPHPCQCYRGDNLRPYITVAPVTVVSNYGNFGSDRTGAKDKFGLPDLPYPIADGGWSTSNAVANFGQILSVPTQWHGIDNRVACLSHKGLGLLAKRVLGFQLRCPTTLATAMALTFEEWSESYLMQAWVRKHGSLAGYSNWMRTAVSIPGVGQEGEMVKPYSVRAGAQDVLLELISGGT